MITMSLNVLQLRNCDKTVFMSPCEMYHVFQCVCKMAFFQFFRFSGAQYWFLTDQQSNNIKIILTVCPKSQTPSLFLTPHPLSLRSHSPSPSSSHLSLCFARSGSAASLWLWDESVICGLTNETWSCRPEREQEVQLGIMCCRWALLFALFFASVCMNIWASQTHWHCPSGQIRAFTMCANC